jgi:transglutaminase-like putative cysteine protease
MYIRVGYELVYRCPQPTPMILVLNIHYSRVSDLVRPDHLLVQPSVPMDAYRDMFGNWCTRLVAPQGAVRFATETIVRDSGLPDFVNPLAMECPPSHLPAETLTFLLGSRYCEVDLLFDIAWQLFGTTQPGWSRVQAICDFVQQYLTFGYEHASPTKTAFQVYNDRRGVCRDYSHLAIAFCRCLNIPARYCTGYLGDIGLPPPYPPMDFVSWFEAFIGDQWYTFDPRNNTPRIGRVLMARGRDAADVAISTSFGPTFLEVFKVIAEEAPGEGYY